MADQEKPKKVGFFRKKPTDKKTDVKKPRSFNSTPTIIARNLTIDGQISSSGVIEIEGKVNGNIEAKSVILLENGIIEGEVTAESFSVRGRFLGTIKAKSVNIGSKAHVTGTIEYALLSVEDGACVDAKFNKMSNN